MALLSTIGTGTSSGSPFGITHGDVNAKSTFRFTSGVDVLYSAAGTYFKMITDIQLAVFSNVLGITSNMYSSFTF
ncbi:unnamed protein product [Leptidea sinapis]|uniref:Uncharacterized protein n=1 Tax=Leptidea sinapis TaxID=189913 RepID=A0A5E4QCC6_9NEOP|nr:unnamed protein product [Leptidea sinapis]